MNETELQHRLEAMRPITLDERGMVVVDDPEVLAWVSGGKNEPDMFNLICTVHNEVKGCGGS